MATNRILFQWCTIFDAWRDQHRPEYYLNRKQIEVFLQNHSLAINFLNTAIEKQNKEYFVHEDGKMIFEDGKPVLKDAMLEKQCAKELNELMNRNVQIVFNGSTI